jgi:hypothetical protein
MDNVPSYVYSYFTKWSANIIEYVSTIGNQIISPNDITIQHLASYYGHRGGKENLGQKLTEEHRAKISAGRVQSKHVKWLANLSKVKTFIADEGRTPRQNSSEAGDRKLAFWILQSKTNNEREQLMRRDIPSVFVAEWPDILERVMTFIATKGRKPRERSSDTDEKYLANGIQLHKRKERGTNSEREQLMRRDIPSVFVAAKSGPQKR